MNDRPVVPFATLRRGHQLRRHLAELVAAAGDRWRPGVHGGDIPTDSAAVNDPAVSAYDDGQLITDPRLTYASGVFSIAGLVVLAAGDEPVLGGSGRSLVMGSVIASDGPWQGQLVDVEERASQLLGLADDRDIDRLLSVVELPGLRAAVDALTMET